MLSTTRQGKTTLLMSSACSASLASARRTHTPSPLCPFCCCLTALLACYSPSLTRTFCLVPPFFQGIVMIREPVRERGRLPSATVCLDDLNTLPALWGANTCAHCYPFNFGELYACGVDGKISRPSPLPVRTKSPCEGHGFLSSRRTRARRVVCPVIGHCQSPSDPEDRPDFVLVTLRFGSRHRRRYGQAGWAQWGAT